MHQQNSNNPTSNNPWLGLVADASLNAGRALANSNNNQGWGSRFFLLGSMLAVGMGTASFWIGSRLGNASMNATAPVVPAAPAVPLTSASTGNNGAGNGNNAGNTNNARNGNNVGNVNRIGSSHNRNVNNGGNHRGNPYIHISDEESEDSDGDEYLMLMLNKTSPNMPFFLPMNMEKHFYLFMIIMDHYENLLNQRDPFPYSFPLVINKSFSLEYPEELNYWGPVYCQAGLDAKFFWTTGKRMHLFNLIKARDPMTDKIRPGIQCLTHNLERYSWEDKVRYFSEHIAWIMGSFYLVYGSNWPYREISKFLDSLYQDLLNIFILEKLRIEAFDQRGKCNEWNGKDKLEYIEDIRFIKYDLKLESFRFLNRILLYSAYVADNYDINDFDMQSSSDRNRLLSYQTKPHVKFNTYLLTSDSDLPWIRLDQELDRITDRVNTQIASIDSDNDDGALVVHNTDYSLYLMLMDETCTARMDSNAVSQI